MKIRTKFFCVLCFLNMNCSVFGQKQAEYPLAYDAFANELYIQNLSPKPTASREFYLTSLDFIKVDQRNYLVTFDASGTARMQRSVEIQREQQTPGTPIRMSRK